jgi:DNA-binding Lrp family transcriptional regulator
MIKELDAFDIRILHILSDDGRVTWSELAEKIGLSLTPTLKRVRSLEKNGYIAGYHAVIDEARVGCAISVFVSVSLTMQTDVAMARFESSLQDISGIMSCFVTTGETDYLLRVVVPDLEGYRSFISILTKIPGVARVTSSFAAKAVIQRSTPPLPSSRRKPAVAGDVSASPRRKSIRS